MVQPYKTSEELLNPTQSLSQTDDDMQKQPATDGVRANKATDATAVRRKEADHRKRKRNATRKKPAQV